MKMKAMLVALAVTVLAALPLAAGTEAGKADVNSIEVVRAVKPTLPEGHSYGGEGRVGVIVSVDARGRVVLVEVRSSTSPVLTKPTADAVRDWRFEPATDTDSIRRVYVPFHFADRF